MSKNLQIFFGLLLVLGMAAIAFFMVRWGLGQLRILDANMGAALIAASVATFGYVFNQRTAKSRDIAEAQREPKIKVYNVFFEIIKYLFKKRSEEERAKMMAALPQDLENLYAELRQGLIVWASPEVIRAWRSFQASADPQETARIILSMDDMLRAIRKDLGNSNKGLKRGDLVKLFLRDPQELDAMITKKS